MLCSLFPKHFPDMWNMVAGFGKCSICSRDCISCHDADPTFGSFWCEMMRASSSKSSLLPADQALALRRRALILKMVLCPARTVRLSWLQNTDVQPSSWILSELLNKRQILQIQISCFFFSFLDDNVNNTERLLVHCRGVIIIPIASHWCRSSCGWCPSVLSNPAGLPAVQRKSLAHDHHPLPHSRHSLCLPGQRHHHDALHARYHQVQSSFVCSDSVASNSSYLLRSNMFSLGLGFFINGIGHMVLDFFSGNDKKSKCCYFPSEKDVLWCHKGHLYPSSVTDHTQMLALPSVS